MNSKKIEKLIESECPDEIDDILLAVGFDDAFLGIVKGAGQESKACYDYKKCIDVLMEEGATREDAVEHFEFNVIGSNVGGYSPVFLFR